VEDLTRAWELLIHRHTADSAAIDAGRAVIECWAEPHRRYHAVRHLCDVLARVEELAGHATDPDAVRLAAWYHDIVYQGRPDDEERSAQRAESDLTALGLDPALVAEVGRLVRLTVTHRPAADDLNGQALCDADLGVLGIEPQLYRENTAAVRAEYAHVPDSEFRAGRARVIRELLAGPLFYTPLARHRYESQARANLADELAALTQDPA
jgi:predicted metal-dependent HD superfamily phosphohydrolase